MPAKTTEVSPIIRGILQSLDELHDKIDRLTAGHLQDTSPWLRGDGQAAKFLGYSRLTFRKWAAERRVRPHREAGVNFWDRAALIKARNSH